jgi:hypothetical protein
VAELTEFPAFCAAARTFWRCNTQPPADPVVLVEAMTPDLRITMRNLATANAIRRIVPSRLVVLTGSDPDWDRLRTGSADPAHLEAIARAYGADDVVDVHALAGRLTATAPPATFSVAGHSFSTSSLSSGIDPAVLDRTVAATAARLLRTVRTDPGTEQYRAIRRRAEAFASIYEALCGALQPVALVTGMVDYDRWGLAVDAASRAGVPVLHVQLTGTLKVYGHFSAGADPSAPVRAEHTKQLAEFFDRHVWPRREQLHRYAELVSWRNKSNLGRPAWWRGGGAVSIVELATPAERAALRVHAMARFGFNQDKPVVVVYNPTLTDALGTNVEAFADPAEWLEYTARLAASRDDANWLFLDHPYQAAFDVSGSFDKLARQSADHDHLAFAKSMDLSRNMIWSLADLGVTIRGSVGAELPAYGVGVVQAGWSEWSGIGFDSVARDPDHYRLLMEESLTALKAGRPLVSDEQVDRARLWMWFYRSATDVPSVFVQHWELGATDVLFKVLRTTMDHVEPDSDPLFASVRRMWERRDPVLTRYDLTSDEEVPV